MTSYSRLGSTTSVLNIPFPASENLSHSHSSSSDQREVTDRLSSLEYTVLLVQYGYQIPKRILRILALTSRLVNFYEGMRYE